MHTLTPMPILDGIVERSSPYLELSIYVHVDTNANTYGIIEHDSPNVELSTHVNVDTNATT